VTNFLTASTHADLLFFTDRGKAYQIKMYELPEGKRATRGKSIMNFISLSEGEKVTSILPMPKDLKENKDFSLMMVTEEGTGKKVSAASFHDVRASGIIAIKLAEGDKLISVSGVNKSDSCVVVTAKGQSIRFKENDVREMGRTAGGVRVIKLKKGDRVIGAHPVPKENEKDAALLTMGANGYGKKTSIKEYKIQNRGGSGIKTSNVTAKTGEIISSGYSYRPFRNTISRSLHTGCPHHEAPSWRHHRFLYLFVTSPLTVHFFTCRYLLAFV
jgi:DNA gyrase subunit A